MDHGRLVLPQDDGIVYRPEGYDFQFRLVAGCAGGRNAVAVCQRIGDVGNHAVGAVQLGRIRDRRLE